ncbi:hypothetical protein SCHPADRAFT_938682 [Schizopora paradoxa]|uniref:F-box domain-containing protein n=1 Tax=Schizopora paradoxa TaxID=27342 RepID=A0A0H2S127_9AGAM|nr:hypothetical protein SCHPADRAFT_938682 [Schizopora paradoxa]
MFEEMRNEMDNVLKSSQIDRHELEVVAFDNDSIKEQRRDVDRSCMLLHINSMQLEIFRRAAQTKQEESSALAAEKYRLIARIDDQQGSTPLSTLPNEVLAQIFSHLYWSDAIPAAQPGLFDPFFDRRTTLQRLVDDGDTPVEWKGFINQQIPCAITNFGNIRRWGLFEPRFGPHPRVLPMSDLHENSEDVWSRPSTTIVIDLFEGLGVVEHLEKIRLKPWRNVLISEFVSTKSSSVALKIAKSILQNFGNKLANLDSLEFYETPQNAFGGGFFEAQASLSIENNESDGLASQFTSRLPHASLPSHLLPLFHPILSTISDLETTIPTDYVFGIPTSNVDDLLLLLTLCSSTLQSMTLINGQSSTPSSRSRVRQRLPFSQLKKLNIDSSAENIVVDILTAIDCPSLRHLTLNISPIAPGDIILSGDSDGGTNDPISAIFLHNIIPDIEHISLGFGNLEQDEQFLSDLANPNESGKWVFPSLDSMKFESTVFSPAQIPLLKALAKVVINRARSDATKAIRCLSVPEFSGEESAYCDTLRLFVPEMQFIADQSYEQSDW